MSTHGSIRIVANMSLPASSTLSFTPPSSCCIPRARFSIVRKHANTKLPFAASKTKSSSSTFSNLLWITSSSSSSQLKYSALLQDAGATALVAASGFGFVLFVDNLTERNLIQKSLSRKVVHIMSGLLFMFSWPIFSTSMEARYFAAFVPFLNSLRLVSNGLSLVPDKRLVKSVSREGNPKELLKGPLYYVLILILSSVLFWRDSPIGVISLAMMCGGDGFADIMGRRFGSVKIPYNQQKSYVGSFSMFLFGFLISIGMLYYFSALGYFNLDWAKTMERVALVSLVATLVESLPTSVDDNISVPLSSILMAFVFFG